MCAKVACFSSTYRALRFCNAGCFAVAVRLQIACNVSANGTGCLLGTGCFTVAVRQEITGHVSANGTGCLLGTGCFTVAVRLQITVSCLTSCTNCFCSTGCISTCAIGCFGMPIVTCAGSCVSTVAVGNPIAKCMGESRYFAVTILPSNEIGNFVGAILVGVNVTAGALIVALPTVNGTGCCLTEYLDSIAVGVRCGTVILTGVTEHICLIIIDVCSFSILLTTFANLPVIFVILYPIAKGMRGCGNDQGCFLYGILVCIKVFAANGTLIICFFTCAQNVGSMRCGNFFNQVAIVVCAKVACFSSAYRALRFCNAGRFAVAVRHEISGNVSANGTGCLLGTGCFAVAVRLQITVTFVTDGTNCSFGAGCFTAFTIGSLLVIAVVHTNTGMRSVIVRIPCSPVVGGRIDGNEQLFVGCFNLLFIKVGVTSGAIVMRFYATYDARRIYFCYLFTISVTKSVAVCSGTGGANCLFGAGCLAAFTIGSCGVRIVVRADSRVRAVTVGCPIAPSVCVGIDCNAQLLLGFDVHIGVKEGVTYRTLVMGLHTCFGAGCILLREVIVIVVVVSRANISASVARGIASIIPYVLDFALNTVLGIGTIGIGTCKPVIGIIVLVSFVIRVRMIDCANRNRLFADYKVCTALVGGITDSNTTNNDLPMRETLAFFGSIIAYQLYVAIVKLTCNEIAVSINCMTALYRDRNENIQCCALTTVRAIDATIHTVECNNRIVVKGVFFGGCHLETECISLAIFEYGFRSQVLVGGVGMPIINDCRILFGICRGNNVGRIFTVCRCNNGEVHLIEQNLVSVKCFDGNCLTCHNKGGSLSTFICKVHTACGAFPTCKILTVGGFVCRNGDSFSIARLTHICCTILNGDGMRCIAVNRLDAHVACGHYKGSGRCRCINEHNVFATYNAPALERLACLGSVCGNGNCNTAANLGNGDFINGCAAVFYLEVKG